MSALASRATAKLAPYNLTLPSTSPLFVYAPIRDTAVTQGWNASYAGDTENLANAVRVHRTQAAGSRVSFTFAGTGLYLCFASGGASFALTLDGRIVDTTASATNAPACAHAKDEADTLLYASGLKFESHSAVLQVAASAEREFRFFGGALEIGVQTGGKVVDDTQIIDDQDAGWVFVPGRGGGMWDNAPGDRLYNLTSTFECNYGKDISATYKFSGAGGAVLLGTVSDSAHDFNVQLDDEDPVDLDATAAVSDGSVPFFMTGAIDPSKEHTITVRNYNSRGARYTGFSCLGIVGLLLLRPGDGDLPPGSGSSGQQTPNDTSGQQGSNSDPDPSSSKKPNTAAIAGGVVGGLAAALLIALLAFFLLRRHRRRKRANEPVFDGSSPMEQTVSPWVSGGGSPYGTPSDTSAGKSKLQSMLGSATPGGNQNQDQSSSNVGAPDGAPRLAQQDLEQVLAFVAQRMDRDGASAPPASTLPQYRG